MVLEYRPEWQVGTSSNTGFSVHHGRSAALVTASEGAQDLANKVGAFWTALTSQMPEDVEISFPSEVLDINTSTGVLEDVLTVTPPSAIQGVVTGTFAAPAGARVEWRTSAIVAGRRLRGRTYIVPIAGGAYDGNGTLDPASRTVMQEAADDYWDEGLFSDAVPTVWSRTHGVQADISQALVPDEAAILRSRRD